MVVDVVGVMAELFELEELLVLQNILYQQGVLGSQLLYR